MSNSGSQEETGVSGVIDITNTGNSSITGISTNYDNSTGSRLITNAFVSSESSVVATTEGSININNASSNEDEGTPNIYGMLGDTAEGTIINSGSDLIGNNQTVNGTININNANSHVQNIYGIKGRKES